MTKQEILTQMNNIHGTLQKDQIMLLEMLNHVMGCTMLIEKLYANVKELEDPATEEPVPPVIEPEEPNDA